MRKIMTPEILNYCETARGPVSPQNKPRAVIAVDTKEGEEEAGMDTREGFHNPFLSLVKKGAEFYPTGIDISDA
jgi:hypothetical protein